MKFEKFVKKAVPYCVTVMHDGQAWCKLGKIYARIPNYLGQIGSIDKYDTILAAVLDDGVTGEKAELSRAYLPSAESSGKDIMRVFSDGEVGFHIGNEIFSMIERYDDCYISAVDTDEHSGNALLVGKPVSDPDNFEPDLIVTNIEEVKNA